MGIFTVLASDFPKSPLDTVAEHTIRMPRPPCAGRRIADTAAHLVNAVQPEVHSAPVIAFLPHRIRFLLAFEPALCSAVRGILGRTILGRMRQRARRQSLGAHHQRRSSWRVTIGT